MVEVTFHKQDNTSKWFVKQAETIIIKGENKLIDKFVPSHLASFVFHFKNRPCLLNPANIQLNSFFVAPPLKSTLLIQISGEMESLIVSVYPTILTRLFNISLSPVPESAITLPENIFRSLWEKLKQTVDIQQRVVEFNNFIHAFHPEDYVFDTIDQVYFEIVKKCITVPLFEIIRSCGVHARTIQKHFVHRVGISPKTLARIVRVNYLWDKIKNDCVIDFQDLVFYGKYFDQAHFIKDFKTIVGETPRHFFNRNLSIVSVFSGKKNYS